MRQQLAVLTLGDTHPDKGYSSDAILSYPAVIGETGVPFDFTRKNTLFGLLANGDTDESYAAQTKALDQNLSGCEGGKCVGWFLWEYSCNNTHKFGDNWVRPSFLPWTGFLYPSDSACFLVTCRTARTCPSSARTTGKGTDTRTHVPTTATISSLSGVARGQRTTGRILR